MNSGSRPGTTRIEERTRGLGLLICTVSLLVIGEGSAIQAQQSSGPQVSIVWPASPFGVDASCIKIQADAASPGGPITNVEFFIDQTSIGLATNAPFSVIWNGGGMTNQSGNNFLTAVASDSAGNKATSAPVLVYPLLSPPFSILKMTSPTNGAVFATTDTIELTAELLASDGCLTGPEEFFVGTNSVGIVNTNGANETFTIATPPFSLTVSNLAEGDHNLGVRILGLNGAYCHCGAVNIQVVKLGLVSPRVQVDGSLTFQVVTAFADRQNVIEASTNLFTWSPISTNQPLVSRFTFRDASSSSGPLRFYRVSVPAQ